MFAATNQSYGQDFHYSGFRANQYIYIKIPPLCHNIILDKSTFELRKGLDEFKELLISRSRPIKQFGKVPDGRTFEETEALLTES